MQHVAGHAGLPEDFAEQPGNAAGLRRGLDDGRVARHQGGGGHAAADGQREIPGTDDRGHAAGLIPVVVQLAHEPTQPLRLEEPDGLAGVIFAEVDGLADVGVGLAPGLARLANHHGGQPIAVAADRGGRLQDDLRAFQLGAVAPGGKGGGRRGDRLPAGIRTDRSNLGHADFGHRFGEPLPLGFLGEIMPRLVEHRPAVAKSLHGGRELMPAGSGGQRIVDWSGWKA